MKEDLVARYVKHVLDILREKQAVTEQISQLDKLSETLGLTAYDLAYLEKQFDEAQIRGLSYMRYRQWDKAIEELEQAILLKPLHTQGLYRVAYAYSARYLQNKREADRQQALYYAERCLQTDASFEKAVELVSKLRNKTLLWRNWAYRNAHWGLLLFTLLLSGAIAWWLIPTHEEIREQAYHYASRQDIPLQFDEKLRRIGIKIDKETSFARQETAGIAYHLRGHLYHPTDEFTHLEVLIQAFDMAGKPLQSQQIVLLDEKDFELRPTDYLPIHVLLQISDTKAQISHVRISAIRIAHETPQNPYESSQKLALKTDNYSATLGLEIIQRYQTIKPEADMFAHVLCLAYQHQNAKPLHLWRIEIQWIDKQDRLVHSETATLVSRDEPLLKPHKWRNKTFHYKIPLKQKDFSRCQILVLSAE